MLEQMTFLPLGPLEMPEFLTLGLALTEKQQLYTR